MSLISRSYRSDQSWAPSAASINWPVTRRRVSVRRTLPSSTCVTPSAPAIPRMSVSLPRNAKAEVRAMTFRPGIFASRLMISSARPSEKYSWSLSAPMLANGSTAMEGGLESAMRVAPLVVLAGADGVCAAGMSRPALRRPSMNLSPNSGFQTFATCQMPQLLFAELQPIGRVGRAEVRERQTREVKAPFGNEGKVVLRKRRIALLPLHELLEQVEATPARQMPGGHGWLFGSAQSGQGHSGGGHSQGAGSLEEFSSVHGLFLRSKDRVIKLACGVARDRRSSRTAKPAAMPANTSAAIQMLLWPAKVSAGTAATVWAGGEAIADGEGAGVEGRGRRVEAETSWVAGAASTGASAGAGLGSGASAVLDNLMTTGFDWAGRV